MPRSASWFVMVAVSVLLLSSPALASDTQWTVNLQAHYQQIGGPPYDPVQYMGVRSGATDAYEAILDRGKPRPPMGDYVYLYWYRSGWGTQDDYAQDWRASIAQGTSKTWPDLRCQANVSGSIIISWVFSALTGWEPPTDYRFTLYDEGTIPNPGGGTPTNMRTASQTTISYAAGQIHYFHVTVAHLSAPTCSITFSPSSPIPAQSVSFNSNASDTDGTVVSAAWTFGDGGTGTGLTTTHAYASTGTYTVGCTVTDNDGLSGTCSTTVMVVGTGNDYQWNASLNLYTGWVGGTPYDITGYFGVRSGATDDYDDTKDTAHSPAAQPPYVYLYWYRTAWGVGTDYARDFRSVIASNQSKTWPDLRAKGSAAGTLVLNWLLGVGDTAWQVPNDYMVTLYDEGIAPNPTGGTTTDMKLTDRLSFSYGGGAEIHYFHIVVHHGIIINYPPTCSITYTPASPLCQQEVAFDSHAADSDGTVASVAWTFGDGGTGTGTTTSHAYANPGTYAVNCTVTDDDGATGTCSTSVTVSCTTISFTLGGGCWHLLSLPCDPINPDPAASFPPGTPLDGNLTRYEAGGYVPYYSFDPDLFGPMQAGVGCWFYATSPTTISYQATCPATVQEINCPYAGWYMIGGHQPGDVLLANCSVRNNDTSQILPFAQAWAPNGWFSDPLFAYYCAELRYTSSGVDSIDEDSYLRQYKGYWFYAQQPNLTLIVPQP